jgi:DNA-directed RNA polymerase sigma subunit (sigma70/sigma32)
MMSEKKITPENINEVSEAMREQRDAEIVRLYQIYKADKKTGWTIDAIGKKFNLTKGRVSQILQERGEV